MVALLSAEFDADNGSTAILWSPLRRFGDPNAAVFPRQCLCYVDRIVLLSAVFDANFLAFQGSVDRWSAYYRRRMLVTAPSIFCQMKKLDKVCVICFCVAAAVYPGGERQLTGFVG